MNDRHAVRKGDATSIRRDRGAGVDELNRFPMEFWDSLEISHHAALVEEMR